ncbi:MAG TPA: ABC transporter substrate-binding protein [bacterium]|nr:ABC transporter substrate-binding protein [bacterium]
MSTSSDPKSFNIIIAKETSTTAIVDLVFEGLTRTNGETTEVEPSLAKGWIPGPDGLSWVFFLRDDLSWSDGAPFTADDVVFTFRKLIFNKDIPNSLRDIFTIEGKAIAVDKIDDHTVKFTLPVRFAPFLRSMSAPILPKHILEKAVDEGRFNSTWGVDTPPGQIVGTGPFMLARYTPGQQVVLKRNPNYWKKDAAGSRLPYLDEIVFLIVQNQDVSFLKFQEGEIDLYDLRGSDYPLLKPREKQGDFTVYRVGPAFGTNFLTFNMNTDVDPKTGKPYADPLKIGWFSDQKFRQAVAHAIDKRSLIDIVLNGLGYPQDSSMSPSEGVFFTDKVRKYEYDTAKARQLLKEAGFEDRNGDGFVEDTQGRTVEFSLLTNPGSTERVKIAEIVRKDLEGIGLKVNLTLIEFNALVSKLTASYDWDCMLMGLTGSIEPHFGANVWQSGSHLHVWHPRQAKPATDWEKEIDDIFTKGVQEYDPAKRKALYDRWQQIVAEQLPVIYTVLSESIFAVRNKFGNLRPTPYGGPFHNIEEIYVKEEQPKR